MGLETNLEIDDKELRQLRANIYGDISDGGWLNVRERWHEPHNIRWLREHQEAAKRLFQR